MRFEVESFAFKILEMEAEKAAGSLRFWSFFRLGLLDEAAEAFESESGSEVEAEEVEVADDKAWEWVVEEASCG